MNTIALDHLCMGCMRYLDQPGTQCPVCGWQAGTASQPHQLAPGSILAGKYLVGRVLGQGGFGITYIGWDIPNGVKNFFQENGTAYIMMEFVEGQTFKEYLTRLGRRMELEDALALLEPVARSLEQVHAAGLIHRDVSPDNIMLTADGSAKLLDFGAARGSSLQGARTNTVNVKMGYAPDEQYRTHGNQGPWTDVYALAATIYRAVTGQVPAQAIDRSPTDLLDRPTLLGAKLTPAQERVLLKGMAVYPEGRYKSVREFYDAMKRSVQQPFTGGGTTSGGRTTGGRTVGISTNRTSGGRSPKLTQEKATRNLLQGMFVLCCAALLFMLVFAFFSNAGRYEVPRYLDNPAIAFYIPTVLSLACVAAYAAELFFRLRSMPPKLTPQQLKIVGIAHAALCVYIFFAADGMEDILLFDSLYMLWTFLALFISCRLLTKDRS